ncbi:MAG TPA: group II intron reverse transcriptase/maturase [Archangium sp.]|nr:group II intron reverse transcriptase/maturase [Archangium sp.]
MSPGLLKVMERAKQDPKAQFTSLAHLLDADALTRAFHRLRKNAAVGVDGITVEQYGSNLQANIQALHQRMKTGGYRHQPIRRVHIPKDKGKTRPIGISSIEDKIVQHALREVLEAIYEEDFLDCSYGFRPGRSAHDALRAIDPVVTKGEVNWILEADIQSYFDSVARTRLMEMLRKRVADRSLLRLVGKCLHVGVLDGEEYSEPENGTAQGSILSPLLGNIYLHHVLDLWFEEEVRPRLRGKSHLVRYADDFVIGFERQDDARRVMNVLGLRMKKYGLTLHPDKTRLLPFEHPSFGQQEGKGPATFDFLGFTLYWCRGRRGSWRLTLKTRTARLQRAVQAVSDFCWRHRHESIAEQHAGLCRRIQGHFNYFGVNGNIRALQLLVKKTEQAWHKWLNRRSQRSRLNWKRFADLLKDFPLPRPVIRVRTWGVTP